MEAFKREIFGQLGNLFYALATEQHMSLLASGELKMAVKKDWLSEASDINAQDKVSEAAHLIGVTIDALLADHTPSSEAFATFKKFFSDHEEQFSYALKQQILDTADTIMGILPTDAKPNVCYEDLKWMLQSSMQPAKG